MREEIELMFEEFYGRKPGTKPYTIESDNRWKGFVSGCKARIKFECKALGLSETKGDINQEKLVINIANK
jgi:hypothetical protein